MAVDPQQVPLSGIPIGIFLMFLGSLLEIPVLYNLGFIIFIISVVLVFVQWLASGGAVELLNWLPIIIILAIILTLSSDFVSQSNETQVFTWPLIIIVLIFIIAFFSSQGGDLSFIVPFLPIVIGIGLLGIIGGVVLWQDPIRGLAYSIGVLGVFIMLIWFRVRSSQQKTPVAGDKTHLIGQNGKTISMVSPKTEGRVKIGGAIWKAQSDIQIDEDEPIVVVGIAENQLILKIEPLR
ncbi:MAG: NfeD family protein [Candidatus Heimdallarchaeota archaeon]|nr:MAG: NfeD family protein [Candidatus Heimdallarchaeota archaeon]